MRKDSFKEKPVVEREHQLWEASKQYMRGQINVDKFEDEEFLHEESFRKANLTSIRQPYEDILIFYILLIAIIALIFVGFSVFIFTKNQFSLIFPAISVYLIRMLFDIFSMKEKPINRKK